MSACRIWTGLSAVIEAPLEASSARPAGRARRPSSGRVASGRSHRGEGPRHREVVLGIDRPRRAGRLEVEVVQLEVEEVVVVEEERVRAVVEVDLEERVRGRPRDEPLRRSMSQSARHVQSRSARRRGRRYRRWRRRSRARRRSATWGSREVSGVRER